MWAWDGNLKKKVGIVKADIDGIRLLWFLKVTNSPLYLLVINPSPNQFFFRCPEIIYRA